MKEYSAMYREENLFSILLMYINLGRFLSGELLQLIFFCEY